VLAIVSPTRGAIELASSGFADDRASAKVAIQDRDDRTRARFLAKRQTGFSRSWKASGSGGFRNFREAVSKGNLKAGSKRLTLDNTAQGVTTVPRSRVTADGESNRSKSGPVRYDENRIDRCPALGAEHDCGSEVRLTGGPFDRRDFSKCGSDNGEKRPVRSEHFQEQTIKPPREKHRDKTLDAGPAAFVNLANRSIPIDFSSITPPKRTQGRYQTMKAQFSITDFARRYLGRCADRLAGSKKKRLITTRSRTPTANHR